MLVKIITVFFCIGALSLSCAVDKDLNDENPGRSSQKQDYSKQTGQANVKFRDIDFDIKPGTGNNKNNKKNKNKNKGGSENSGCNIF
jgi:hypothetical protein